jgi:hypothetical protein
VRRALILVIALAALPRRLRASGFGVLVPRHPGRIIVRARISAAVATR